MTAPIDTLTLTGSINLPIKTLGGMLASLSAFWDFLDIVWEAGGEAAAETAAKDKIFVEMEERDSAGLAGNRPFAMIHLGDAYRQTRIGAGSSDEFRQTGSLDVLFEADVAEAEEGASNAAKAMTVFTSRLGAVVDAMLGISGGSGRLSFTSVSWPEGAPVRASYEEREAGNDYIVGAVRFEYY